MFDSTDLITAPKTLLLGILRALWWLGWDFFVQTVGWSIGWPIARVLTLGRFPHARFGGVLEAHWTHELVVEALGLAVLAKAIWWLSGVWPHA